MANEIPNGIANEIPNGKPDLNEEIIKKNTPTKLYIPPKGVFVPLNRRKFRMKNGTGFTNAKQASMLEKGWRLAEYSELYIGKRPYKIINKEVLIEYYDGPSVIAKLLSILNDNDTILFEFQDPTSGSIWQVNAEDIRNDLTAIYFRNNRKNIQPNKTRRQKGGFYPSVFGGVRNATMLMPLIMRQCYRMWESKKTRRRKH
jgi:hypothetical protein